MRQSRATRTNLVVHLSFNELGLSITLSFVILYIESIPAINHELSVFISNASGDIQKG